MTQRPKTPGQKIGPYVLRRKLGEGAMGVVWLAVDPNLRREVAIKLLQPWEKVAVGRFSKSDVAISSVTNTVGTTTNYLDLGAATNVPAFYYRVRLVP